jgi:hypothetical protein
MKPTTTCCLALAIIAFGFGLGFEPVHAGEVEITILHTNDLHQHLENLSRIAYQAKRFKAQHTNTVFFDAGDYFDRGSILATLTQGDAIYGAMHRMGYDAWTLGNHDWAYGADRLVELMHTYPTKVLCTNVGSSLEKPPENLLQTWVTEFDDIRVGFVGATTGPAHKTPLPVYRTPLLPAIRAAIKDLQAHEVDLIAAVTHLGVSQAHSHEGMNDLVFAKEFPEIKIIVGGHSHTLINQEQSDRLFEETGTIIVQAGGNGRCLGVLTLTVDDGTKAVTSFRVRSLAMEAGMKEDPEVAGFVAKCFEEHLPDAHSVLGELAEPTELYNMGYWYADFLRMATGTDIVIVPRKSLYDEPKSFAAGPMPVERMIGLIRDRRVVTFSMKGSDLIRYFTSPDVKDHFNPFHLEHRNAHWLYLVAGAYYYSGMQVDYHADDESVTFDLNPEKTYTVATLWPFLRKDTAGYRFAKPSVEAARRGTIFPGLALPEDKEVLADTTWDLLRRQGKHGELIFHRRHKAPLPQWVQWTKDFEDVAHVFLPNVPRP